MMSKGLAGVNQLSWLWLMVMDGKNHLLGSLH